MDTYKLHFRVGPHEFAAEGAVEDVRRDFDLWKRMIEDFPAQELSDTDDLDSPNAFSAQSSTTAKSTSNGTLPSRGEVEKLYLIDEKRRTVALRILPRSEERKADCLILLLLGYRVILSTEEVPVTVLRPSLKQSGCSVDRVDSIAEKYVRNGILNKGGRGKGGKYSLTRSGVEKAKALATEMLMS